MTELNREKATVVKAPKIGAADRRRIRSHAMRHVRRMQRQARNDGRVHPLTAMPACSLTPKIARAEDRLNHVVPLAFHSIQPAGINSGRAAVQGQHRMLLTSHPQHDETVTSAHAPGSGDEVGVKRKAPILEASEARILPQPGGTAFHRYVLQELFGASLIGSSVQRPRNVAISDYRKYVAATRSDIVKAADDAVCLLLPACTLNDPGILLEARKRHLVAVRHMRNALESDAYDIDATIAAALELLFTEIFQPVSLGMNSLYEGVVHLARTHTRHLTSSQAPVTRFLLVQLRQVMLLQSLASRTPLPVGVEMWHRLPCTAPLLPEMAENLMQLVIRLPGLLSAARDAISSTPSDTLNIDVAISELLALQSNLSRWQTEHCTQSTDFFTAAPFVRAPQVSPNLDGSYVIPDIRLSPHSPSLSMHCQTLCYICLLLLRESLADLAAAHGEAILSHYYSSRATIAADVLCRLAAHFAKKTDDLLDKALSVRAPLHFVRQWYMTSGDCQGAEWAREQEARVQTAIPFLSWPSLLPLSVVSLYMQG